MMRFWIGLTLLSGSWLFGLEYFSKANFTVWIVLVGVGTLLMCAAQTGASGKGEDFSVPASRPHGMWRNALLAVAFVPMAFLTPWPYRMAPLLVMGGFMFGSWPHQGRWLRASGGGLTTSGIVLLAQALALPAYKHITARSHELPWPGPQLLAAVIRLLGINASADQSDLVLPTMRLNHHLGATWEMFLDPATLCFVAGGLAALIFTSRPRLETSSTEPANKPQPNASGRKQSESQRALFRTWRAGLGPTTKAAGLLLLATLLWLPLRAGLEVGVFLHRALRTDYEAPLNLMNQFWSPWPNLLLLLPLALLAARWLPRLAPGLDPNRLTASSWNWPLVRPIGLSFAAIIVLTLAILWDPIGSRKPGRIAVDEFHSKWEPTGRPFDTEWYGHLSGYNYASIYDYCSHYYEMSRLTNTMTDAALAGLDVLVLKVPTERFAVEEVDAIVRFVERGGGLLLIGEHTDVFSTGYNLNSVARRFGFEYRYDCLFGMESFFDQFYQPWQVPHPSLGFLRNLDFATSCSLHVGGSSGRGVIVATALKNSMADYHANNYYPQAVDHAAMRSGAFVQLWSTRQGRGRIMAFTDSTIFSNFSTFEPGKSELMLGMLEWLNRQDGIGNPRPFLLLIGAALLLWGIISGFGRMEARPAMIAAGALGWSLACLGLQAHQRNALPLPKPIRPCTWVTIDRTLCDGPLSKGGFIAGKADGFGIFERWILRLGYFTRRESGKTALEGNLVAFLYPTMAMTREYREALLRYVTDGGTILVVDSPKNEKSTAAGLLQPFGLSQKPLSTQNGTLSGPADWPAVPIEAANEISGGRALFRLEGKPVGVFARHGKGTVIALGFGSRFADPQMGVTGDVEPGSDLRKVFALQFNLVRAIIQNKLEPLGTPAN